MIVHVTGGKVLPKEIEQQIIDRTDGVPLFIDRLAPTRELAQIGAALGTRATRQRRADFPARHTA
jgi:hypothetical protein